MNSVITPEEKTATAPAAPLELDREYIQPPVNIFETKDSYQLEAEMPGVAKAGLTVSVEGNVLTLEGRVPAREVPGSELLYRESRGADYRRVFELDPAIEIGKIEARLTEGILTLTLPKAEAVKPRKIAVA